MSLGHVAGVLAKMPFLSVFWDFSNVFAFSNEAIPRASKIGQ